MLEAFVLCALPIVCLWVFALFINNFSKLSNPKINISRYGSDETTIQFNGTTEKLEKGKKKILINK